MADTAPRERNQIDTRFEPLESVLPPFDRRLLLSSSVQNPTAVSDDREPSDSQSTRMARPSSDWKTICGVSPPATSTFTYRRKYSEVIDETALRCRWR
ncbi:hypothetical protein [Natrinema soli]|uniref:Uncharacterized protein n=1 Tax=Natrinema soli TaxID=1930624 RepID=A0ABD5SQB4_9EURY|nr:hypothetical protein [Natrinema soli]